MKIEAFLNTVTDVLMGINVGRKGANDKLTRLDRGILDVALMIAALDGEILPAEVAAYYRLLGKCRGLTKKDAPAALNEALRKAGYLIALKQTGTSDKTLLSAFVNEAMTTLPVGFEDGSLADVRRAFVFWTTMGHSDGGYSTLERSAVQALADGFAKARAARGKKAKTVSLLEEDFLANAERLVKDMSVVAKRAKAQAALDALISTVQVKEGNNVVTKPAQSVSVRAGAIALLIIAGATHSALADGIIFRFGF